MPEQQEEAATSEASAEVEVEPFNANPRPESPSILERLDDLNERVKALEAPKQ